MGNSVKFHQTSFQVGATTADAQANYVENFDKVFENVDKTGRCEHDVTREFCAKCIKAAKRRR